MAGKCKGAKNVIERAVAMSGEKDTIILPEHLPESLVIKVEENFRENEKDYQFS